MDGRRIAKTWTGATLRLASGLHKHRHDISCSKTTYFTKLLMKRLNN